MTRKDNANTIRQKMRNGVASIGTWMQIPHASIAEILGGSGLDWVAVDLEHGSFGLHQLPDIFRAIELGDAVPMARLAVGQSTDCKAALDAGAGGVIIPMIESAAQLRSCVDACCWPPTGTRGVGFSRANRFGETFESYKEEAQNPIIVAMIEHVKAVDNLADILSVDGLDAILVGPYDLSASIGKTGQFDDPEFLALMEKVRAAALQEKVPYGVHVVSPDVEEARAKIAEGCLFLPYSIDAVLLAKGFAKASTDLTN